MEGSNLIRKTYIYLCIENQIKEKHQSTFIITLPNNQRIQINESNPSKSLQYLFCDKNKEMIVQKQQIQPSQCFQAKEQLVNGPSQQHQDLNQEDLFDKTILDKYLFNYYSILKKDQLELAQLCKVTDENHLEWKMQRIRAYLKGQQITEGSEPDTKKKRKQVSSEFTLNLKSIPIYSMIFFRIWQIPGNRFNMVIHNSKGQCLGYFWKQLKCKKITKLRKVINSSQRPLMIFVLDYSNQTKETLIEIFQKIKDQVNQFVYIFKNESSSSHVSSFENVVSKDSNETHQGYCMNQIKKQIITLSKNISQVIENESIQELMRLVKGFSHQQAQLLENVRGNLSDEKRNLQFDFLIVNIFRAWNCSYTQIIVIIQDLYKKQKQRFQNKIYMQKQKQIQRQYNRDPNNHFPERVKSSKICKRCENQFKKKIKKTKFRCEGCSITFKRDIWLCALCFQDFHQRIDFFRKRMGKYKISRKPRAIKAIQEKNSGQIVEQQKIDKKEVISLQDDNNSPQNEQKIIEQSNLDPLIVEKTKQLDRRMTQTFEIVQRLKNNSQFQSLRLFLSFSLNSTMNRMRNLSLKYEEFDQGFTKMGSQAILLTQSSVKANSSSESKRQQLEQSSSLYVSSELESSIEPKQQQYQ